jgi:WD40 repeat protein
MLLTGSRDNTLRVWDSDNGDCLTVVHGFRDGVRCIDYLKSNPDYAVAGSYDNAIRLVKISTGSIERTFQGHAGHVFSLKVIQNDTVIVSASADKTVKFWDIQTGTMLRTFTAHQSMIISLDVSPDDRLLVTGSDDNYVRVWDMQTLQKITEFTKQEWFVLGYVASHSSVWSNMLIILVSSFFSGCILCNCSMGDSYWQVSTGVVLVHRFAFGTFTRTNKSVTSTVDASGNACSRETRLSVDRLTQSFAFGGSLFSLRTHPSIRSKTTKRTRNP